MRRPDICLYLGPAERAELQALIANRNTPRKLVWRAEVVLATADGHGTFEIMRRARTSKPTVWRWQERYLEEGVPSTRWMKSGETGRKCQTRNTRTGEEVMNVGCSTTASCRCGYTCRAVFGGTRNATTEQMRFPHYCAQCGVVNTNPHRENSLCPQCRSVPLHRYGVEASYKPVYIFGIRLRFLERTTRDWDKLATNPIGEARFRYNQFSVTEGDHRCPGCGEMTLRFDDMRDSFFD
ncbi:helix-turn-helix domain-containing protein [Tabrizicola sp.]|uniref:helix-turn-helix domain-containing protein n=1 Tax=Tabrizicola sp. TaxID=2005166 RepID=UPI003D2C26D6